MTHHCCDLSTTLIFSIVSPYLSFTVGFHKKPAFANMMMKYSLLSINTGTPILLKKHTSWSGNHIYMSKEIRLLDKG